MKRSSKLENYRNIFKLNWRIAWYGVFVWVLSFVLSSLVILPWFYIVFPLAILAVVQFYLRKPLGAGLVRNRLKRAYFAQGLSVGFFWFFSILIIDYIQFVGLDFSGAGVYFLDPRNFIKYPIVILIPMIYGLVIENNYQSRSRYNKEGWYSTGAMRLHT